MLNGNRLVPNNKDHIKFWLLKKTKSETYQDFKIKYTKFNRKIGQRMLENSKSFSYERLDTKLARHVYQDNMSV